MNRQQCRAEKRTNRMTPQTIVLWVQAARGYLADFTPERFTVVESADLAQHFNEDRASAIALSFKRTTGLSVALRPYYSFQQGQACTAMQ